MRLKVSFCFEGEALLNWNYLDHLRGVLYSAMACAAPRLARHIHERGFEACKKTYKLLTFSLLFPRQKEACEEGLLVRGGADWFISSPLPLLMEVVAEGLLSMGEVRIGKLVWGVERLEILRPPKIPQGATFKTLSPLVASTGKREGGRFLKVFLSPGEEDFGRVLKQNLERKFWALYGEEPRGGVDFEFHPPFRSKLFRVSGTDVKGWELTFSMRGDPALMRLAYDAGLGERNTQGFGMIELSSKGSGGDGRGRGERGPGGHLGNGAASGHLGSG